MDNLKSVGEMSDEELRNELASVEGGAGDEPTPPENNAGSDVSQMSDEELEKELAALEGGKRTPAPQADTTPAPREDAPIKEKRIIARNVPLADKDELRQTGGFSTGEYVANKLAQEGLNPIEVGSDDGRLVGMGKTLGNLFVSAGARPLTNLHSMRQQQLMRGFVDAPNGGQKRVADMSDEEQDYMADEAGINGWSGAARNILGFLFSAAPKLTEANRIINGDFTPVVSRSLASITGKTSNEEAIDAAASVVGKKVSRWAVPNGSPDDNPLAMWDATEGANEPNDLIRREKRAAYLQQLAQGMVTMTEQDKENARREAAARNPTDDVDILGETVIQGGYSIPFMVDPTHFALPAAMSATSRYGKMKSDAYRFDESGNLTVASRRETDDAVAAAKAGIGGVAEAGIERVGGEVVSKVGGSLLKHTIGKLPVFEKVGEKITTSAVGKAMAGFARKFRVLANYTGVNQFHEEIAEEFEQDIIDRGLGIDLHPDEMDGNAASRSLDVTKDFFKPSNLWKLSQSMIGMMVFQGGAAYAYDRLGSRRIDAVLEKGLGVDAKELGNYTQAEKKAAFSAWVNSWDEQKVSEMFGDTTKYVTELTKLVSQHSGDFDFGSVRQGKDGKFKVPTRTVTGADGKTTAQEVWRNEADGEGRPCRVMTDNESGVTIREYDDGSGNKTYRIGDTIGSHRTAGDLNQALAQADTLVAENNVRKAKVQFLQGVAKRMYGGADVFYADNLRDAVRGLTNEYGVDEVRKLMGTDEFKAGKDAGQSFHFTDENGKDVIVFMLNRIRNADEALTAATHEGGAHSGLTKAVADKRAFLQNIDMKSLFRADRVKFMEVLRDQAIQRGYLAEADKEDSAKVEAALRQTMQDADAAEEVFAYLTEDNGANFSPKMKDMVVAAARDLHRKMFKSDLKYNASDIYAIAARGRKALAKGSGGKATVVGRKETETAAPAPSGKPAPAASGASAPTGGKSAPVSAPTATPTAPTAENGAEVDDFGDEYAAFADYPTDTTPTTAHKGPTTAPSAGGTTSRPTSTKPVEGVKSTDSGTHTAEGGAEGETTTTTTTESVSVSADTSAKDAKAKTHNFNRAKKRFMDALAKYARAYNRGRHKGEYDVAVKELDAAIAELFASPTSAWKFKVTLPDGTQTTFNLDARIKPHPQTGVRQLDEYQVRSLVSRICPAIKDKSAQIVAKRLCDRLNPMVASHVAAIFASKSHQGNLTERQRIAEENFRGKKRIKNWCDAHPESLLARWFNWFGAANPKMFAEAFSQSSVTDADLFAGAEDAYAKKGWDTALEEWANGVGGFAQMGDGSFDFSGCYETLMKQYEEAFAETRTPEQIAEDDEREHEEWLAEQEARERDAENEAYDFIGSAEARDAYDRIVAESKLTDDHGDPVGSIRDIPDGAFFTVNGEEFQMLGRAEDGSVVVEKFIEFDDIRQYTITPTESGVDVKEVDYDYETRWIDGAGRADVRGGENREADGRAEAEARRGEVAGREAEGQAAAEADAATGDAVGGASRGAASVAEAFGGEGVKWRKATADESNRLDGVPTRKVYRGMQLVDGKLYSPMAGKINGKWTDPQPVGEWIVADEHPELRLKNGKFTLNQGNKNISSVDAAYNPYWHTSESPLNDQFSGAYLRPELVTVECEIPMTDEVDGKPYYAEGAKDAVGEHRWPQGPVSRQIVKQGGVPRTVFLSRYCKITRIVPDAEVAKVIMEKVGDKDVTFPINTVSPNLRTELSKLGAKFGDPEGNASQKSRAFAELEKQGVNWRKVADDYNVTEAALRRGGDNLLKLAVAAKDPGGPTVRWRKAQEYGIPELGTMDVYIESLYANEFSDGETRKSGGESTVVRVGDYVYKFRNADDFDKHDVEKICFQNELLDEYGTGYDVIGTVIDTGYRGVEREKIVLRQPYIEPKPNSGTEARLAFVDALKERFGYENVWTEGNVNDDGDYRTREFVVHAGPYMISDLKDANIAIDAKDGKFKVWDCMISKKAEIVPQTQWRKSSFKANPTAADLSDALGMSIEEATALGFAASRIFDDAKETRMNSSAYTKNAVELALVRNKGRLFTRSGLKATADRIREWMQDYNIKLRRMEEALGVTKDKSAYYAADRAYGRIADMATEFQKECIEKLAEELSKAGISSPERYADFGLYLLAKHGAEYNRMIAQRSRYVADAVADPTAQPIVSAVLAGTRDLDDAAVADIKTALNWSDAEAEQFAKDLRGSSQSSKFWAEKLRDFDTAGDTARFAGAEAVIRDMTKRLRELLVSSGRLSRAQADTWESLSPNYVPMMHEEESEFDLWSKFFWGANEKPTGRFTKSYTDSETKHGFGRTTMPENPIPFVIQQYQSAIQRAADNEVRRALADMVRAQEAVYANDNTKPRIGKVFRYMSETERKDAQKQIGILSALPTRTAAQDAELARLQTAIAESNNTGSAIPVTKVVGQNGLVYEVPKVSAIENENPDIIAFKEDGDLKFVKLGLASGANAQTLVENNGWLATSDAQDIGRAIKKQSLVSHAVFENLRKVTGLYSALRTAWSPTFLISNFLADNSQAARNLYSTFGAAGAAKFEHFTFGRNSLGAARAVLNRKYGTSLIQQYAKEWAENGGRIGGMATETAEKIQNDFARQLRMAAPHLAGLAKINTPEDAWNYVSDKWYGIRDLVETGNSIVEMSTRIASYATFREMTKGNGKTDAENIADAVSYSRDVTVNFNRKGRLTPIVNALYAFSNASIQDIQRSLEAFGEKRYGAAAANMGFFAARTGMKMGVGLMLLGFLNAWLGFGQDDPDKEKQGDPQWKNQKEYVKQNKIVFRVGDKTFSIPVRGLSRIPYYLGHNLYEVCVNGNKSAWQAAKDITDLAVNNLTDVIGSAPTKLQAFMPSAVRPGVEIAENKTFSGSQMYREPFKNWGMKWNLGRMNTPTVYHKLAYYMNWLGTGGHPERTSALDVQPEKLQAYWQWLTGSLGRDVQQLFGNAADMAQGRMPDLRNAFGASRFLGKVDENSARYHEAAAKLDAARDELKKIDPDDTERLTEFFQEHPYLHRKNRRWDEVLKGLASDSTQMLKMEMRETDEDAKKETHKTRLLAQQLFMEALEANPKKYDADAKQDFKGREKLVTRFVKQSKRDDKREQKRNEREMRKSQRNIPFMP